MQTVNYYDVLGVSPTADDFVIKAAYKALAQRYHPDKFRGNTIDATDAEAKMRQLNEAYQVLSDPAKRREYNASFQQRAQENQQSSQQKSEQAKQQEDWAIALRFYPDLTELETRLGKIDPSLVSEFRSSLLASQQYEQRQRVASQLEQNYLEDYFGSDPKILECARDLLIAGHREVAKELNRMLKVVGGGVSSEKIIDQLVTFDEALKLAARGSAFAQFIVGSRYENGLGVNPNIKEAINWYKIGANNGYSKAKDALKRLNEST